MTPSPPEARPDGIPGEEWRQYAVALRVELRELQEALKQAQAEITELSRENLEALQGWADAEKERDKALGA